MTARRKAKTTTESLPRLQDPFGGLYESIKKGDRIGLISGPGQFPQEGLCRTGTVYEKVENDWGRHLVLTMDDHSTETVHGLTTVGIGAYLIK